ncbi:hypothetical protein Poli38472_014096 [Pythium oligandrum]|uniref:Uncharacterized protein n=1 Tax=Pythium oligandrum TaxID=41045 RepID=A0A8K1CPC4_PYTOL|nr:hypothetical protein Poli38472_014096 [Pythium oligandrum]|eukprot:TMW66784.1 hypothetical protein Poli38472_014096 [Pythium oligandrum]
MWWWCDRQHKRHTQADQARAAARRVELDAREEEVAAAATAASRALERQRMMEEHAALFVEDVRSTALAVASSKTDLFGHHKRLLVSKMTEYDKRLAFLDKLRHAAMREREDLKALEENRKIKLRELRELQLRLMRQRIDADMEVARLSASWSTWKKLVADIERGVVVVHSVEGCRCSAYQCRQMSSPVA